MPTRKTSWRGLSAAATIVALSAALTACGGAAQAEPLVDASAAFGLDLDEATPEFTGVWREQMRETFEASSSSFVRDVLRDGEISRAEVTEAVHRANACLELNGIEVHVSDDPDDQIFGSLGAEADEVTGLSPLDDPQMQEPLLACLCPYLNWCVPHGEPWIGVGWDLPGLYTAMQQNPFAASEEDRIAACLVRHQVVDAPFTGQDLIEAGVMWHTPDFYWLWAQTLEVQLEYKRTWPQMYCFNCDFQDDGTILCEHINGCRDPLRLLPNGVDFNRGEALECQLNPTR